MLTIVTVLAVVLVVLLIGLRELAVASREQVRVASAVLPAEASHGAESGWRALDRWLGRNRIGARVVAELKAAGVETSPAKFLVLSAGLCLLIATLLGRSLSVLLFPVGLLIGAGLVRFYVRRQRTRRREEFIGQMPELARTLSNATSAGLSVRTALAMAADELAEPAASELRSVTEQLSLGVSLESALDELERRLPSREVAILASTLVVSARSGGGLVTALRDIAGTLETSKETRREVRTIYAQAVATAYSVLAMGVGVLFLLDRIQAGTVDIMLRSPLGQGALVVAAVVYAAAIYTVRRMTRVEV